MTEETAAAAHNTTETAEAEPQRYELMVLLVPETSDADREKELFEVRGFIKEHKGSVFHEELTGEMPLAYRIKKRTKGYYAVFYFEAPSNEILGLTEAVRLFPSTMRHLLVKLPENFSVETMKKQNERILKYFEAEKARQVRKKMARKAIVHKRAVTPLKAIPAEAPESKRVPAEARVEESEKKPLLSGQTEKERLESVDKKLSDILDNPDIDLD